MRDFLPGPCAYDPDVSAAFQAIEQNTADAASQSLARVACNGCIQLQHCTDQREAIALETAKQGTADTTMIGGEVIDLAPARLQIGTFSPLEALRDPVLTFEIAKLPHTASPQQKLDLVRQAFRAGQLRMGGTEPIHTQTYTDIATKRASEAPVLGKPSTDALIATAVKFVLRHRGYKKKQYHRNKPLSVEEVATANELFDAVYADAAALAAAGAPPQFALYHRPELFAKILEAPLSTNVVWKAHVNQTLRRYPVDPFTAIARLFDQQEGATRKASNLERQGIAAQRLRKFHAQPAQTLEKAALAAQALRKKYPEEHEAVNAMVAGFPSNPEAALLAYLTVRDTLPRDPRLADLGAQRLATITRRYPFTATEVALRAAQRLADVQIAAKAADVPLSPGGMRAFAQTKTRISEENLRAWRSREVVKHYLERLGKPIKTWLAERIIETTPKEKYAQAFTVAGNLFQRGVLAYEVNEAGYEQQAVRWSTEAEHLTEDEKLAVLWAAGLTDALGMPCDESTLQQSLGVTDLQALVQQVLVPGLFPPEKTDILGCIRYVKQQSLPAKQRRFTKADFGTRDTLLEQLTAHLTPEERDQIPNLTAHMEAFANSLVKGDTYGHYLGKNSKPTSSAAIAAALHAYLDFARCTTDQSLAKAYLTLDPLWAQAIDTYTAELAVPSSDARRKALRFRNPLAHLRRYAKHHAYIQTRSDAELFSDSHQAILAQRQSTQDIDASFDAAQAALMRKDRWTSPSLIKHYAARARLDAIEANIAEASTCARSLYAQFGTRITKANCIAASFRYRNPHVVLAAAVTAMDGLIGQHLGQPYMNDAVAYQLVTSNKPGVVEAYITRYHEALAIIQDTDFEDYSIETIAHLAVNNTHPQALQTSCQRYVRSSRYYQNIPEVEQLMVDNAFQLYTMRQAEHFLAVTRQKIAAAQYQHTLRSPRTADQPPAPSAESSYLDAISDDAPQHHKQAIIMRKLAVLDNAQQAAVLATFDLYDLMSEDMLRQGLDDTAVLASHFGVADHQTLQQYVQTHILPLLVET